MIFKYWAASSSECAITFTYMHLADAFIQSDLQCIQVIHVLSVCVFPGNWTHNLCAANAMLYHWATGTLIINTMNLFTHCIFWLICKPPCLIYRFKWVNNAPNWLPRLHVVCTLPMATSRLVYNTWEAMVLFAEGYARKVVKRHRRRNPGCDFTETRELSGF